MFTREITASDLEGWEAHEVLSGLRKVLNIELKSPYATLLEVKANASYVSAHAFMGSLLLVLLAVGVVSIFDTTDPIFILLALMPAVYAGGCILVCALIHFVLIRLHYQGVNENLQLREFPKLSSLCSNLLIWALPCSVPVAMFLAGLILPSN